MQDTVLEAIQKGLVASAHDCSEGGLAVALAECCITDAKNQLGASVKLDGSKIRPDALIFGETQSRIIVSAKPENAAEIEKLCKKNKVPVSRLGSVGKESLKIAGLIDLKTSEMDKAWRGSIPSALA